MKGTRKWLNPKYEDRSACVVVTYDMTMNNIIDTIDVKITDCQRQIMLQFNAGVPYTLKDDYDKELYIKNAHKLDKERENSIQKARILRDVFDDILTKLEGVEDEIKRRLT